MADGSIVIDTKIDSSGAEKGIGKLNSIASKGLKGFTGTVAGVGAVLGGIGAYALKVGSDFEEGMSKVKAISGATADDMVKLSDKAKEMGAKTKFSATESAEAMQYMAMAGWKTEQMLNGLPGIMNLAAASGEELASVSDIVTDAMTAFGMKAEESGHFADILAQASSNSNTNVAMLGESFKYVAPLAGSLKYSAEDTSIALGLMASGGIKASQSGTSLKTALVNMAKPTSNMKAVMDQYGLSLQNTDGSMKSLKEVMDMLRDKMGGLDEATKASASAQLFGKESLAGMLAVINASPEDYDKLTNAIYNCDGASQKIADTMNDNLKGQVTLLKSALEGLGIQLYESVDNPMKDIVKSANDMVGQLSEAFKNGGFEGLTEALGNVFAQIVTGIAEQAPVIIDASVNVIQSFLQGIQDNLPAIAQGAVGIVTSLTTGLLETLPMLLEIGVQAIGQLAIGIGQALPTLIPCAVECIANLVTGFYDNMPTVIEGGLALIQGLAEGIINAIPVLLEALPQIVESMINYITTSFPMIMEKGKEIILNLVNGIVNAIPQIISALPQIITTFINGITSALPQIIQTGIQVILALVQGIVNALPQIAGSVGQIFTALVNAIANNLPQIIQAGLKILGALGMGLIQAIPTLIASIPQIIKAIWNAFTSVNWGEIGLNIIKGIGSGITGAIKGLVNTGIEACKELKDNVKSFFGIHSPSRVMRDEVGKHIITGICVGMQNELPNLLSEAKDICKQLNNTFKQELNKETAQSYINSIYNWGGSFSVLAEELQNAKDNVEITNARRIDDNKWYADAKYRLEDVKSQLEELQEQISDTEDKSIKESLQKKEKALQKQQKTIQKEVDYYKEASQEEIDIAKKNAKKQLDIANQKKDKLIQLAKGVTDALKEELTEQKNVALEKIDSELKAEEEASNRKLELLDKEYKAKIDRIDKTTNRKVDALKEELKALDEQKEAESRKDERKKANDNINVLKTKMANTKSEADKRALALKIKDVQNALAKKETEWDRADEKEAIQEKIDNINAKTDAKKKALKEELEEEKRTEKERLETLKESYKKQKKETEEYYNTLLETDNLNAQVRYIMLTNSNEQLVQLLNSYAPKWQNAGQTLGDSLLNGLNSSKQSIADAIGEMVNLRGQQPPSHAYNTTTGKYEGYASGTSYNHISGLYNVDEKGFELSTNNNPVAYVSKGAGIFNHMQSLNAIKKEVSKQMSAYANKLRSAVFADQMRMGQLALAGVGGYSNSTTNNNNDNSSINFNVEHFHNDNNSNIEDVANELGFYARRKKKC